MKKNLYQNFCFLAIIVVTITMALTVFSACFDRNKDIDVTIEHHTRKETVTFNTGAFASQIKVSPDYVEDKILLGYYDTQDDSGNLYFDFLGRLTTNGWKESYPTKLYAVYESLDTTKVYHSSILHDENPYNPAYKYNGGYYNFDLLSYSTASIKRAEKEGSLLSQYADTARFIYSNGNKKVKITLSFYVKQLCDCCDLDVRYRLKVGSEAYNQETKAISQTWMQISVSTELFAKQLKGNQDIINYISLQINPTDQPHPTSLYSVKNIYYTIELVE